MPGDSTPGSRRLNVLEFSRLAPVTRLMINCGCDVRWRLVFFGVSVYKDICFCVTALASRQVFTSGYEGSANPFLYPGLNRSLIRRGIQKRQAFRRRAKAVSRKGSARQIYRV